MTDLSNALKNSAPLQVHAYWDPIADSFFDMHKESPEYVELFDFSPSHPIREYATNAFNVFLPSTAATVGDVWKLKPDGIVPFLQQFHPGATTKLGYGNEGAFACLRALSSDYAEIVFRVHADFVLDSLAHRQWQREKSSERNDMYPRLIPAQFAGKVLINLKTGTVQAFSLALPARNSNIDIGAFGGVDMVFVPRMELVATDINDTGEIAWDTAITEADARKALALRFYRFAEIDWLPIEEAVAKAKATERPIHAILVWGAFDDESC